MTQINIEDLSPEIRKTLGIRRPRQTEFTAEDVATHALRALAAIAGLSRSERERVLKHALKLNNVKVRSATAKTKGT